MKKRNAMLWSGRTCLSLERLPERDVPAALTVQAATNIRSVNDDVFGANLAYWDWNLNTSQTRSMVQASGMNLFRFPGGSSADTWHFTDGPAFGGAATSATFASFISQLNAGGMTTINYGTGSPQEGAAWLAWLNAPVGSNVAIGNGPQWSDAANAWVTKNWQTSGYWASLRAANPLAVDDGLNHLRVGRASPFGFHFVEVGNEIYGNWETDHHAIPWHPATYIQFTKSFAALAAAIDPTVVIGVDGSGTGGNYGSAGGGNWTAAILDQCVAQGYTPGFISDHLYMFDPGNENDDTLLRHSSTDPAANGYSGPINVAGRAAAYRTLLNQKLGANAASVQLLCTELGSVTYNPSNQTTSLVNGLWLADTLGGILKTEYNAAIVWDLRNYYDTSTYNPNLYGWRTGGDYGMLGDPNGAAPASGTYTPYPTYFAEQIMSKFAHQGDMVVTANSDSTYLTSYAVKQANGHLALLVINKSPNTDFTAPISVQGFVPATSATLWQYGKPQDTAQQNSGNGAASLLQLSPTLTVTPVSGGANFSFTFPQYSMTVLDLAPAAAATAPTVQAVQVNGGAAQRSRVTSVSVTFSQLVNLPANPASAFSLTRQGSGATVALSASVNNAGPGTVVTLSFTGGSVNANSLADGRYTLSVFAGGVSNANGILDGDNNGAPGGDYVLAGNPAAAPKLYRLFGDADGDNDVDTSDFAAFRAAFGTGTNIFDFDNDGDVDTSDFGQFRGRFGATI